ncbi:MAG: 30S ribosomal protein S4 [Patescibacteria group bacterium]|jgi:small subunit ribosomal protein S4
MVKQNVCKKCRRESIKLFLKGERCNGAKCAVARRIDSKKTTTGRRGLVSSEYGHQLREKQKVKSIYGISEKQLVIIFKKSLKAEGNTSELVLQHLERRLDNIVYRLGFGKSRAEAKQMVSHGHIKVNKKKVNISSYELSVDDTISLGTKFELVEAETPDWLKIDKKNKEGKVLELPTREQIPSEVEEQLIIEFYSR